MDPTQLDQVLTNLVVNARDAITGRGRIEVVTANRSLDETDCATLPEARPGDHVCLSVADSGCGMAPELAERIFEPFFTTKPVGRGTGLGLATVHGIVKQNHGVIQVESEPGKGTRVDVWIPAHSAPQALGAAPTLDEQSPTPLHIMLVEDEDVLGRLERRQLQSLGHRVTLHHDSVEALDDFRARPAEFDLLITDNTMPRMTGLQLARAITGIRPGMPVLMVSGYADNADIEVMHEHGVDSVLAKPHSVRELAAAIALVMDKA